MADLQGPDAEINFTIQVTRKETGAVETYDMVGFTDPEKLKAYQEANKPKE